MTFHLNGNVIRHNIRIWVTEGSYSVMEHGRDSPKFYVLAQLPSYKPRSNLPIFFMDKTVTSVSYFDMMQM